MTMPLVQLGPGGDYVRKIVPTDDRLRSISRPFTHPGHHPADAGASRGVLAFLITALRMIGVLMPEPDTDLNAEGDAESTSESKSEPTNDRPRRSTFIDRKAARRLRASRPDEGTEDHARHDDVLERCLGIDRIEISPTAFRHLADRTATPNSPPLETPVAELLHSAPASSARVAATRHTLVG
ncbi:MAG: hypothetical protein GY921_07275, partial [Phycisphaeraceae bacterium]|nr:hypothetical protein [Phycisphaeraceae bacterium]